MRKIFLYFSLLLFMQTAFASDSLFVRKPQIPILIDRTDNILVEMRVQAHKGDVLNKLSLQFKEGIDLNDIKALRFFYSGTEATSRQGKHYRPVSYISSHAEGKTKAANPAYSIKQSEVTDITNVVTFTSNQPMVEGVNYYWISIEMKPEASLLTTFTVQMPMAEINNMPATIVWDGKSDVRRMGIGVRHAGAGNNQQRDASGRVRYPLQQQCGPAGNGRYRGKPQHRQRTDLGTDACCDDVRRNGRPASRTERCGRPVYPGG